MYIVIWILQSLLAFVFMISGINKTYFNEKTLVQKRQTGVEGLPGWFIKLIGVSEILGSLALVVPILLNRWIILTPIAAICLGFIMIPAALIHNKRKEPKNVMINILILLICIFVAYFRLK